VIVVGGGVMGCATAYAAARQGLSVGLVEQFRFGHNRGSSHGRARIFRLSYPDQRYIEMALEARELWRRLETDAGDSLLLRTGGLDAGPEATVIAEALQKAGQEVEWLGPEEICRRWPAMALDTPAALQPETCVVRADHALSAFLFQARTRGCAALEGARVHSLHETGAGVTLECDGASLHAPVAVLTVGAWAPRMLASLGIDRPLTPTRQTVAYFSYDGPPVPTLLAWGNPPLYALMSPGQGIKAGEHGGGPEVDPDEPGTCDAASVERLASWVSENFPGAASRPHLAETCLYTNTPDEDFILERRGRIVVGSPCSGHGFKFAPLIGERLTSLAREVIG
jgi:sarcosine oxidase